MKLRVIVLLISSGILLGLATVPAKQNEISNEKMWTPIYDQSIDPDAAPDSIWLLVNPRSQDCEIMVQMVANDMLASEAVYDPWSPCVKLGFVK